MKSELQLLKEANDILRSVNSIIERKGNITNWEGIDKKVKMALAEQHELLLAKNCYISDVSDSIFFNVPLITYEKTRLKLSKEELEEFKTKTFTSDRAFFIWDKLPKDTRPELEFFMEWFYDDVHF